MVLNRIQTFIATRTGLDPAHFSSDFWKQSLFKRMEQLGVVDVEGYYKLLTLSPMELQELIEYFVVSETWFFRDSEIYELLVKYMGPLRREKKIHLLSVPCSTGEEPYSMAIALTEAGFRPDRLLIDGVDISKNALRNAENGLFTQNAFRGVPSEVRELYFSREGDLYRLTPAIKSMVQFHQGNLCDKRWQWHQAFYDVVFCRNLLVYLIPEAKIAALNRVNEMLKPGGLLFLSPVDCEWARRANLKRAAGAPPYVFEKSGLMKSFDEFKRSVSPSSPPEGKAEKEPAVLAEARRCADEGQFERGEEICRRYLEESGPDAEAYFLLGLIHHARREETEAYDSFTKAIYFNPNHYESLIYLALMNEMKNNAEQAHLFRERAARCKKELTNG